MESPVRSHEQAIWIDSSSRENLKTACDDVTVLVSSLFNTQSAGLFHVQKHVAARAPVVIDIARVLGQKRCAEYSALAHDVASAVDFGNQLCEMRQSLRRISSCVTAEQLLRWTEGGSHGGALPHAKVATDESTRKELPVHSVVGEPLSAIFNAAHSGGSPVIAMGARPYLQAIGEQGGDIDEDRGRIHNEAEQREVVDCPLMEEHPTMGGGRT
jgi:hypothetical protein